MKRRDYHAVATVEPIRSGRECLTLCGKTIRHAHLAVNVDGDIQKLPVAELAMSVGCRACVKVFEEFGITGAKYLSTACEQQEAQLGAYPQ